MSHWSSKGFLGCSNFTRWKHIAAPSSILRWQLEYSGGVYTYIPCAEVNLNVNNNPEIYPKHILAYFRGKSVTVKKNPCEAEGFNTPEQNLCGTTLKDKGETNFSFRKTETKSHQETVNFSMALIVSLTMQHKVGKTS